MMTIASDSSLQWMRRIKSRRSNREVRTLDPGNMIIQRAKSMIRIIVPLFVSSSLGDCGDLCASYGGKVLSRWQRQDETS